MKVYELAKELGLKPKELLDKARAKKIKIKSHLVVLDETTLEKLRHLFQTVKVAGKPKKKIKAPHPPLKEEPVPLKVTPISSLIDKPAHTEKEVRALHPQELEGVKTDTKEKRQVKVFAKPIPPKPIPFKTLPPRPFQPAGGRPAPRAVVTPRPQVIKKPLAAERKLTVTLPITLREFSEKIGIKTSQMIQKLMQHNLMVTINDFLNEDTLILLGLEFNYEIEVKKTRNALTELEEAEPDKPEDLKPRPPVVVIMGHVDHGKTTLLDRIRSTNVAAQEAGQITQHLGAYQISLKNRRITFLDTPGHQAFTQMRARGANVTDIAVLVVAADDGVMPQTEEAINHIKEAKVAVIVAINKVDKKEANVIKTKQQLATLGLNPEDWGGATIFTEVSAITGQGIDHLLEMILLQADMLELKANPNRKAVGTVLEARLTPDKGPWATVLVQNGTLRKGDAVVCGSTYGKIRALYDDKLNQINEAPPATPVEITGLDSLPEAGNKLFVVDDVNQSKEMAEEFGLQNKTLRESPRRHLTMETLFTHIQENKVRSLGLIIKTDVKGSLEALNNLIAPLATNDIKIRVIHTGVGAITESDVILADASDAVIIGFNVHPDENVKSLAQGKGVQIKVYTIVYQIVEDLKLALSGLLEPEKIEVITAHLIVRQVFKGSRIGTIAGCYVQDGKIQRTDLVRVKRGKEIVFTGKLGSLKRFKDDVSAVGQGLECGVRIEGFDDSRAEDVIESYRIDERARKI